MKNLPMWCVVAALTSGTVLASPDPMKAFPEAEPGYQRVVIQLPQVKDPDLRRVQLIPGKVIEADCNTRGLRATIEEKTAAGWGYNYWVVGPVTTGPTTMMACPEGSAKKKFVPVYSETLLRYNPKLPLVVYVPNDIELRYKIWSAPTKAKVAK
ncbi:ecotin family protein [Chitinibacter sp. SCUT-21]|uniref:ecotin family protein n=1 Tax=Chitinibacter sp. SCUT-21 TaxID=2970891 RepID=UPI0035A677BA